jgi:hypothetical protein
MAHRRRTCLRASCSFFRTEGREDCVLEWSNTTLLSKRFRCGGVLRRPLPLRVRSLQENVR